MNKFTETLHQGFAATYQVDEVLYEQKTEHQHLLIFKNNLYGRIMALDGIVQTTEKDEFIYHEMFVHVPMLLHPNPKHILIVGGGDGGILREVCKYPDVASITMVEIDPAVVNLAKTHLPNHSAGAFEDPRLRLVFADGLDFITTCQETFDVILSDSTDPIGPGAALFAETFYAHASRCLSAYGLLVTQNGVSFMQTDELVTTQQRMQPHFAAVKFFQSDVPTYVGGNMNHAWGQKAASQPITFAQAAQRFAEYDMACRHFHPDMLQSAFCLPQYLRTVLSTSTSKEACS